MYLCEDKMLIFSLYNRHISFNVWFTQPVYHFAAANHHFYLVYVHQFLLYLSVSLHLDNLLKIGGSLYISGFVVWVHDRISANRTPHPNGHGLQSNQLPVVQAIDPFIQIWIYLNERRLYRLGRLDFHVEIFTKVVYEGRNKLVVLMIKFLVNKKQAVSLQIFIYGMFEVIWQMAFYICIDCSSTQS